MGHMNTTHTTDPAPWFIIPCGAQKLDGRHAAQDLYTGQAFRHQLAAALADTDAEHVLVLSAAHGLLRLTDEVDSYNLRMGQPGSVTTDRLVAQILDLGIVDLEAGTWGDVYCLLPSAYFAAFDTAARQLDLYPADTYEAAPGIGYQRGVCSSILRTAA